MKIQLETITSQVNRSFSMMYNPRLSDLFFWHSHPEYELVYIEADQGTRHIGDHISTFRKSDLVLIGSDIPHLNFDYGIRTEYSKVVVHLDKDFVEQHFTSAPELSNIKILFEKSKRGIAFTGDVKNNIGNELFNLQNKEPMHQYLKLIEILNLLALEKDLELLHNTPFHIRNSNREQERLRTIRTYIDQNYNRKIDLEEMSRLCYMTKEAFCRYFKKTTQYTFVEFLNRYRISHAKRHLMTGETVSRACYLSGFQSLSYFNRVFKKITNENPSEFRAKHNPQA